MTLLKLYNRLIVEDEKETVVGTLTAETQGINIIVNA